MRFQHKYPKGAVVEHVKTDMVGVRFVCSIGSNARQQTGTMSIRGGGLGTSAWQVDKVRIHCAGFPILGNIDEAANASCSMGRGAVTQYQASDAPSAIIETEVTVCVPRIFGHGFSTRTLLEFIAWYILLGARRIVFFDSMEPELEVTADERAIAQERMEGLYAIARAMPDRISVVRGLATFDFMRRTMNHADGQSLANNLCKDAVGVIAAAGGRTAYIASLDVDEFLSPPVSDFSQREQEQPPERKSSKLAGALSRLTAHMHDGRPATGRHVYEDQLVNSRVHAGRGTGRCLSFAGVYYSFPACADGKSEDDQVDLRPPLLRMSWRSQPDNFELGPSHNWTVYKTWNFNVHAKYVVDANSQSHVAGIHDCCCAAGKNYAKGTCVGRHGPGKMGHSCATVEFMPLEYWHVRHLRSPVVKMNRSACQYGGAMKSVLNIGRVHHAVWLKAKGGETNALPAAWELEYETALRGLSRHAGREHPWTTPSRKAQVASRRRR